MAATDNSRAQDANGGDQPGGTPSGKPPLPKVILALEGGGARGIVHVGALHAIGVMKLDVIAYSGTSAGAMVATLAAAGYPAEEILSIGSDPPVGAPHRSILQVAGVRRATDLFGRFGWWWLLPFRLVRQRPVVALYLPLLVWLVSLVEVWPGVESRLLSGLGLVAFLYLMVLISRALLLGTSLTSVRARFDRILRASPAVGGAGKGSGPGGEVTFRDIRNLKICASNVTRRRLEVFSFETSPDLAVADAVCASICFPFAFTPWTIRHGSRAETFLDGGLLSNLPAWCLDEERQLHPDAVTLAVSIGAPVVEPAPAPPWWSRPLQRLTWLPAMISTSLLGGQVLSTRGVGWVEVLRLDTDLDVFAFDIGMREAVDTVRRQSTVAAGRLRRVLVEGPAGIKATAEQLRMLVREWLERRSAGFGERTAPAALRVRIAFAVPEDHIGSGYRRVRHGDETVRPLMLHFTAGFDDSPDDGMLIPVDGTIAGDAWRGETIALQIFGPDEDRRAPFGSARLASKVPSDTTWVLAVPVPLPPILHEDLDQPVSAVLVMDSNSLIDNGSSHEIEFADELVELLAEQLLPVLGAFSEAAARQLGDGTLMERSAATR